MSPEQQALLEFCAPPAAGVNVNDHVCIRTEGLRHVVLVHAVIMAHYDISDRAPEEYAMLTLFDAGYADQDEIARSFGYSTRSIRRYEQRFESGGLLSLGRTPGRPSAISPKEADARDRTIFRLKERGFSNRGIAQRLGLAENSVRKRLRRLGWKPQPEMCLPFPGKTEDALPPVTVALPDVIVESSGPPCPDLRERSQSRGASGELRCQSAQPIFGSIVGGDG
jgi:transposase